MDIHASMPYYAGGWRETSGPLTRFLPPVPDGIAQAFLNDQTRPAAWILDPFGASPRFAVEMARSGRRVLVAAGNPVARFLLDLAAHPPSLADLQSALADLSAARKDGERLETHIQALYNIQCLQCKRHIPAEAFLWDSKTGQMVGKIYNCACGAGGEHPVSDADREHAAQWARTESLHRTRVLGRISTPDDPHRPAAEEALDFYLPRAIYALATLINRLDSIPASTERRRCITALILWACDAATSLWPHPAERPRPRQLTFPGVFRENNIWMSLENSIKYWDNGETPVPLSIWPEEPPDDGGLCIFEGPLRELAPDLADITPSAVVTVIPRPNQAFWTLSALWAGWLWGRDAVGPFRAVLRRKRYDWAWQMEALQALFGNLYENIEADIPIFALLAEPEPDFTSAAILAGQSAQFQLKGFALRGESEPVELKWQKMAKTTRNNLPLDVNFVRKTIRDYLAQRNEPTDYFFVHASVMVTLAEKNMLPEGETAIQIVNRTIAEALTADEFIDTQGRANPVNGVWALRKWQENTLF